MSEKEIIEKDIKFLQAMIKADQEAGEETSPAWINELKKLQGKLNPTTPSTGKEVTAVQELIEIVEMDYNNGVEISMKVFHKMLTKALVIEKQQITEAFTSGQANISDIFFDEDGLNYFTTTYDAK